MPIAFIVGFRAPSGLTWRLVHNTQTFISPLNGASQTVELPGARWEASLTWANLTDAEIRQVRAWLASLRGRAGRFYLHDMSHPTPAGTATAALVNGAGQAGASLVVDGMGAGATLKAGDYFSVNGELKMLTADATANASGQATLVFEPPLRVSPADNAVLTLTQPTCTMRLADDAQDTLAIRPRLTADWALECVEAFN